MGRPKTTGRGVMVGVRFHPPLLDQINEWAETNDVSRPEAVRLLCIRALKTKS